MSKSRGPTKAEQILAESKERLSVAQNKLADAREKVGMAEAVVNALQSAHFALERSLAKAPRKRTPKPPALNPPSAENNGATLKPADIDNLKAKLDRKKQVTAVPENANVGAQ